MDRNKLLAGKKYYLYKDPLFIIIVVLLFVLMCRVMFVAQYCGIYVVGSSMSPTLTGAADESVSGGDYLYAARYAEPDYGDIVVVETASGKDIIKRVIALGGDSLYIQEGVVYIMYAGTEDYVALEESYVDPENNTPPHQEMYNVYSVYSYENPYVVEEGYMYLLGDNRNVSHDSRYEDYGAFPESSLVGVITDWSLKYKNFFTALYSFFAFGEV